MRPWIAAAIACAALTACGNDAKPSAEQSPTTAPPTTAPASVPPTATVAPTVKPTVKPTQAVLKTDLKDGRHYAYLKGLDTTKLTLTVDVVQFLTGEEAEKAAAEDGEEAYDYYIRNQNPQLRTLTLASNVTVVVNTLTAEETGSSSKDTTITLAKLRSYFDKGEAQKRVFYVTLSGSRIVKINEQYLP